MDFDEAVAEVLRGGRVTRFARIATVLAIPIAVLGMSKVHAAHIAARSYDFTSSSRLTWAVGFTILLWMATYAVGLPSLVANRRSAVLASLAAVAIAALAISIVQLALGDALLPRFVVFGGSLVLVPLLSLCGVAGAAGQRRAAQRDRVYFVGGTAEAAQLARDLEMAPERPAVLAGSVTVDELLEPSAGALPPRLASAQATLLVLDTSAQGEAPVVHQAAEAHELGMRVRTLSLFYEQWLGKLPVSELERVSLLFDVGEVHRARYARAKRLFDITVGLVGTVIVVVLTPVVWIGNLVANRGPLLFRQQRVGKGGSIFTILKFRTMRSGGEDGDGEWTSRDDPRVTPFGRVLRISHLDELPQAVNILKGDLSFIGPRPEQPRYVDELTEKLPFYRVRHLVRPGLTGWAQVKYGYAGDERDALEKLQYEFFYLRRQGLALDLKIALRTPRSVLSGSGRGR